MIDGRKERKKQSKFDEVLRSKTVGEQMEELPKVIQDYFVEWLEWAKHQDAIEVINDYDALGIKSSWIGSFWYLATIKHNLKSLSIRFISREGRDFTPSANYRSQSMTIRRCMNFLEDKDDIYFVNGTQDDRLIDFFKEVEGIRRGSFNLEYQSKDSAAYRLYCYFKNGGIEVTNDNQEVGRGEEELAREKLQSIVEEGVYIIHNGTTGAPDLIAVFRETKDLINVKSTGELSKRASVTYSKVNQYPENLEAKSLGRPYFYLLVHDRFMDRWTMLTVPVDTPRVKVTIGDFQSGLKLPESFGKPSDAQNNPIDTMNESTTLEPTAENGQEVD